MLSKILYIKKKFFLRSKKRGQIFLISTFLLVAYTIPILITLSELKTVTFDESKPDLFHYINEYSSQLNYLLQELMYLRTTNGSTNTQLFSTLQFFQGQFTQYLLLNGITGTFRVNTNDLTISADNGPAQPINTLPYQKIIFVKVHVAVVLTTSINNNTLVTDVNSFYGIKVFVNENSTQTLFGLGQIDSGGKIIKYLSDAEFTTTTNSTGSVRNLYNGYYDGGTINTQTTFVCTLPSGIKIYS